ncbi:sigma-54 dependent transcriptional regulator [Myxococcota bacterium]|nr:sigma-54 dependent transcriptional regulator [Myxococcota bacterium]
MERVVLVADSDVPVLLLGETGSGKEVVARAMRNRSRRASGPFVRVNCGAIPAGLIDSELFGHERGSFSGAMAQRQGWFERANGGTLFLDEVGELPLEAQVRLLRVLQDGAFERVGGEQAVHVDVRVIAATHRDLRAMVREGRFREDLWYRLAIFPIEIPPLRERLEDIPSLATHFALRACERFGCRALAPTAADLDVLARYAWPGNVRELASVLDRAVILGGGERLDVLKALGPIEAPAQSGRARGAKTGGSEAHAIDETSPFPSLDRAMAMHIEAALARCLGRIEGPGGAAQLLEINPHTLRARMRKLGVDWNLYRDPSHKSGRAR